MAASSRLATRYRLLLLSYPRSYRLDRGEEIVDLMMDLALAEKHRPTAREAVNLLLHGLRARLGRPASRSVAVWATITSVLCGLFLGSFATWLAWQTAEPLPQRPQAIALFSDLLPDQQLDNERLQVYPATFVFYSEPLGWNHFDNLISGDGGELAFGSASVYTNGLSTADVSDRLRTNGWEISEPTTRYDRPLILAQRGSDIIELEEGNINLIRDTPWAVYPLSIVGVLLGMALGWILFGWASRRTEHRGGALAKLLFGLTMFFWSAPLISAPSLFIHHLNERHIRWHPLWEFLGQPTFSILFLAGCVTSAMCLLASRYIRIPSQIIGTDIR